MLCSAVSWLGVLFLPNGVGMHGGPEYLLHRLLSAQPLPALFEGFLISLERHIKFI